MATKTVSLARRARAKAYIMTGGVANRGVVKAIEDQLGKRLSYRKKPNSVEHWAQHSSH